MIETLVKIGVCVAIYAVCIAALTGVPAFAALIASMTDNVQTLIDAVNSFGLLINSYISPYTSFLAHLMPSWAWTALVALIGWKLIKPFVLMTLDLGDKIALYVLDHT